MSDTRYPEFDEELKRQVEINRKKWDDTGKSISLFYLIAMQQMEQLCEAVLSPSKISVADEAVHVAAMMQEIWERVMGY